MREFELYGTVSAIISVCDSINYILDKKELTEVFRLVNNYLDPKGIFIFDFNTRHYYLDIVADATIAEDREDISFIWDNLYDAEENINELYLSLLSRLIILIVYLMMRLHRPVSRTTGAMIIYTENMRSFIFKRDILLVKCLISSRIPGWSLYVHMTHLQKIPLPKAANGFI